MATRVSRAESQAQTREALLAAAREAFLRDGYDRASLAGIAEAAGVTTGAVYANFPNKDALFLAVLDERTERSQLRQLDRALSEETFDEAARAIARLLLSEYDDDPRWARLTAHYWARAATDPAFRELVAVRHAGILDGVIVTLEALCRRHGRTPVIPLTEIARGGGALSRTVRLERVLGLADACSDEIFEEMFLSYVRGLMR